MSHYPGFNQFGGGQGNGNATINPQAFNGGSNGFSSGSALINDDELFDLGGSPTDTGHANMGNGQDFGSMGDMNMGFSQGMYPSHTHINGYSNTPDGDPIQSPFVHSFGAQPFRQMQQPFANSLQSPLSYTGSHMPNHNAHSNSNSSSNNMNTDGDSSYLATKSRARMSQAQAMQRKTSDNARSPLTTTAAMASLTVGSQDSPSFGTQPIRTPAGTEKSPSGQWLSTPKSLQSSYPGSGSGLSSPMQQGYSHAQYMAQAGTSMPARVGNAAPNLQSQEAKRKRRRESHNAVERRRRDNINERIQDLSKLVPTHRLEDDKIKKLIQNGTPISPTLTGMSQPGQATSGLAGPGAKRATGAGSITTGLPIDDKDKGPNKGDILNGSVSWMRDLMWMLHLKLQQQEELVNTITEMGGHAPFEMTDDERRMQTELMEAIAKSDGEMGTFSYSRFNGSGLRVPHHTDFKGESLNGATAMDAISVSPDDTADLVGDLNNPDQFWNDPDDDIKEEDEFMMTV